MLRPQPAPFQAFGPVVRSGHSQSPQTGLAAPVIHPHAHGRRGPSGTLDSEARAVPEVVLDPLVCHLAMNQCLNASVQPNLATPLPAALPMREDLQNMLVGLARRIAWGGDRRKGTARIELSGGALAGATLIVHTEQRSVEVELELPQGMAARGWQQRISERLEARGFSVDVKVG